MPQPFRVKPSLDQRIFLLQDLVHDLNELVSAERLQTVEMPILLLLLSDAFFFLFTQTANPSLVMAGSGGSAIEIGQGPLRLDYGGCLSKGRARLLRSENQAEMSANQLTYSKIHLRYSQLLPNCGTGKAADCCQFDD